MRVSEWRQARAAAAAEAKKQAEAEQAQGWKRVTPQPTARTSRFGWLRRAAKDTHEPIGPNEELTIPPSKEATPMLSADDLAWLDATTTRPQELQPQPQPQPQPPASLPPPTDPYKYDPDDDAIDDPDDEFGEIQAYTDGEPTPLYDTPLPRSAATPAKPPALDLLSHSPPASSPRPPQLAPRAASARPAPAPAPAPLTSRGLPLQPPPRAQAAQLRPTRDAAPSHTPGRLTHADLDFFENL